MGIYLEWLCSIFRTSLRGEVRVDSPLIRRMKEWGGIDGDRRSNGRYKLSYKSMIEPNKNASVAFGINRAF